MPRPAHPWLRKGRGWYCTIDGRQVPLGKDEQAARIQFNRLMAQKRKTEKRPISGLTVKELLEAWIDRYQGRHGSGISPQTTKYYREVARSFIDFAGHLLVSQLEESHLLSWLDSHSEWSKRTRATEASTIKLAFQWAAELGLIPQNPFASVNLHAGDLDAPASGIRVRQLRLSGEGNQFRLILDLVLEAVCQPGGARSLEASGLPEEGSVPTAETEFCPRCGTPISRPPHRRG